MSMYKSFNGNVKEIEELDSQHLSNIYWYNKIIFKIQDEGLKFVTSILEKRNEEIKPYIPHPDFKQEIETLDKLNVLFWNEDRTRADIIYKSVIVGYFESREFSRDKKINSIMSI